MLVSEVASLFLQLRVSLGDPTAQTQHSTLKEWLTISKLSPISCSQKLPTADTVSNKEPC